MRDILIAACFALAFAAPALAAPALTVTPAIMHRGPSVRSHIVQEIPANAQIDLQSCTGGWCYASWRDLFGYVPADAVAGGPPPLAAAPPAVVVAPTVVAPAWGWGGPYMGFGWGYGWRRW